VPDSVGRAKDSRIEATFANPGSGRIRQTFRPRSAGRRSARGGGRRVGDAITPLRHRPGAEV